MSPPWVCIQCNYRYAFLTQRKRGWLMLHLFCVVTQQSYEMPWSSSHPILSSFQPVLPSSQENIHVRRLCSLLGCFVLQRKIQGFSNHARKRWLPAYQFGYMLTLYSKLFNRILFFFFLWLFIVKQWSNAGSRRLDIRVSSFFYPSVAGLCKTFPTSASLVLSAHQYLAPASFIWFCRINISKRLKKPTSL